MHELRRHAPVGRPRRIASRDRGRGLPHLYAARKRGPIADLYMQDKVEARRGGGFRWFFSTCLAATVGAVAILAVILGSMDATEGRGGILPTLKRVSERTASAVRPTSHAPRDGLRWATPKVDRLQTSSAAMSAKYIVQEAVHQRRGNREYIHNRPYARIVVRLASVPVTPGIEIPPFSPLQLYANTNPSGDAGEEGSNASRNDVSTRVVELLGSGLPMEDGQEMDAQEITDLVSRVMGPSVEEMATMRPTFLPEGAEIALPRPSMRGAGWPETPAQAASTTTLEKSWSENDEISEEIEGKQVKVKLLRGETLSKLLQRMGAEPWQARLMVDAAKTVLPESAITPAYEIELTMAPTLAQAAKLEPVRFAVYDEEHQHKVTVGRNAAGEFIASQQAQTDTRSLAGRAGDNEQQMANSRYASLYYAALQQGISPETIQDILRVHAYETDFRRRAQGSDALELFFDLKDEDRGADSAPGDLLFTAVTVGGDTQRYYRFRSPDGQVDYYDESGNNSRKFLMRRPVRSDDVRLVSGFGLRFHPLLNSRRMHTGVDWAGPIGTPILAAGNGVIEEVGPKGQYGNYIRIKHANGYQTAYGHMSRFDAKSRPGAKVRQGEVIGYIGNTGLSTGPHVHFEVLVSNRYVDPMSIQVPREKKLDGKELADFHRERSRIDDLMRRPPVRVQQAEAR